MHVLVTGARGTVGRFLTARLLQEGHTVTALGRAPPTDLPVDFSAYDLGNLSPELPQADALIHCALSHVPGKFRGGEGQDPGRFWRLNVDGTGALFNAAKNTGCRTVVFLSSRAVYGDHRREEVLREGDRPEPETLYGQVKLAGERLLADLCDDRFSGSALRVTGVYGLAPGRQDHKWSGLFSSYLAGEPVEPRCATEVHGDDLASAVSLILARSGVHGFGLFNVSDLVLDRCELLSMLRSISGEGGEPPPPSSSWPGVMETAKLRALGWTPGGLPRLRAFLEAEISTR